MAAILDLNAIFLLTVTIVVFFVPIFILFPPIPVERSDALRQTHRRLGLPLPKSNLQSQFSSRHQPQPGRSPKIGSLFIYPIKSCQGIELDKSKVVSTGLEHDRLYTFAQLKPKLATQTDGHPAKDSSPETWEFLTQRQLPLLANVKVELWLPDSDKASRQLGSVHGGFIVVKFPWRQKGLRGLNLWASAKLSRGSSAVPEKEFMLPLEFPSEAEIHARGYKHENVKIWLESPSALNMTRDVPPELAAYLGIKNPLGLFRSNPGSKRAVFRCAPRKDTLGYQPEVDFHDAYPLHLISLTSVRALESKICKDDTIHRLDARRFRANIIISGSAQYDEDDWRSIKFTTVSDKTVSSAFDVSCRTVRCKLLNVDPATGIRHKAEPDSALRKFRDIDEGAPNMGCLGMQLCPTFLDAGKTDQPESFVEVGMELDVLEKGSHLYIRQGM